MKLITSVKNLFLYSLLLLITVCGLWFTPPSALAAPVNLAATQYIAFDTATDTQSEIQSLDELISELRATKVSIGKDESLSIEEKKERLAQVNSYINDLIKDKKALLPTNSSKGA